MNPASAPHRAYQKFVIQFSALPAEPNRYTARIAGPLLNGQLAADEQETCSFDPAVFKVDDGGIEVDLLEKLSARTIERPQLFQVGRLLSDIFLPGSIRRRLHEDLIVARERGLSLRLHLDIRANVLRGLPCEYLYLPAGGMPEENELDFLALDPMFSIVRELGIDAAESAPATQTRYRMVAAFASPPQQPALNLAADRSALERMTRAEGAGRFDVEYLDQATRDDLLAAFQAPADVFHFSGHGTFDGDKGQIILEGGDFGSYYDAELLANLLRAARVRLAVLSACQTGQLSGENVWGAVVTALQRAGVAAVVASQFRLRDANANVLTATLYRELLAGATVDEAIYRTRQAIYQKSGGDDRDWGAIVLYARRGTDVIFQPPPVGERHADQPSMQPSVLPQAAEGLLPTPKIATPAVTVDKDVVQAYLVDCVNLDELCAEIQQTLENRGITVELIMEMMAGSEASVRVGNLIEWLDERGFLDVLVAVLIATFKDFMEEAFDIEELSAFCRAHFPEVFALFRAGQSKSNQLEQLLNYIAQHNQYPQLAEALDLEREDEYEKYVQHLIRLNKRAQMDVARSTVPAGKPLTDTNLARLKAVAVLSEHADHVLSIAFSRDGKLLATGSEDARVRLWDTATGKLVKTLSDHSGPVTCLEFTRHGLSMLASGSLDETVCVWNAENYERLYQWKYQTGGVKDLAFTPGGSVLVTGTRATVSAGSMLYWWDMVKGKLEFKSGVKEGSINCLTFHPHKPPTVDRESTLFVGLSSGWLQLFWIHGLGGIGQLARGFPIHKWRGHDGPVLCGACSQDGELFASGSEDGSLCTWKVDPLEKITCWPKDFGAVTRIGFSNDGTLLLVVNKNNVVNLVRVSDGKELGWLNGHNAAVTAVAFSPDGRTIATGSLDRTVCLWRVR